MIKRIIFPPRTLKGRLTGAVMGLVALACLGTTAIALEIASWEMRHSTGRQQFALLTSAALHLESELDAKRALLKTIAEEISADGIRHHGTIQTLLEHHPSLRSRFLDVVALNQKGQIAGDLEASSNVVRAQFADKSYFDRTINLKRGVMSEPIISTATGKAVVLITQPVTDASGHVAFVLVGGIDLENPAFFGHIARLSPNSTGYIFAMTQNGIILHHPNRQLLARSISDEYATALGYSKSAFQGWEGWTFGEDKSGATVMLTYKQVTGPSWILGSSFPAAEAFAGIDKARRYAWASAFAVALVAGVIGWVMMIVLLKPLRTLRRHVHAVEYEAAEIEVLDIKRDDEVGALGRAFHSLSVKRLLAEQQLKLLSQTDALTGLDNRRQFDREVQLIAKRLAGRRQGLGIIFLDVDNFKSINDTYGHAAGDAVLKEFACRLLAATRPTDRVYRLAGDEFVIISERLESAENGRRFATRILHHVREPFCFNGNDLVVTASVGVAVTNFPMAPVAELLRSADGALYQAKRSGRDGYSVEVISSTLV